MKLSSVRSLKWTDILIYSIVDPRAMYRHLKEYSRLPLALSFLVPAIVAITEIISGSLLTGGGSLFYYRLTYGWILHYLLLSFFIVVTSSLMDMAGQFVGFRGNVKELIAVINFSLFPKVFLLPLVYIFYVVNFAPTFFYCLCSFSLFIWSALIAIQGISEMHGSDIGKSLFVYIFPVLMVGLVGVFSGILLVVGIFEIMGG